jgi:hypothetical protein
MPCKRERRLSQIAGIQATLALRKTTLPDLSARARAGTPTVGATILTPDLTNILPRAETLAKAMFLWVGGKTYEVASFAQASQMFCIARDKNGEGASKTPSPLIVDDTGSVIAHVSYNGRVWPGDAWTVDAIPLYDNREA